MREDVQRLLAPMDDFATHVIDLVEELPTSPVGRHIGGQLLRSGTSTAANYEEACAAESRADFIHKMQISLKEMRESRFWLRMLKRRRWAQAEKAAVLYAAVLYTEADELCRIFTQSVVTAKKSKRPNVLSGFLFCMLNSRFSILH
ncbi:MAG TPA: four helix bundle protein [Armatimonadota bacterium]|nr:four helix bundle protein [Armatimonadota bacterium]HOS43363.1 four helix bundle protein [Armatimonadota bacterium]